MKAIFTSAVLLGLIVLQGFYSFCDGLFDAYQIAARYPNAPGVPLPFIDHGAMYVDVVIALLCAWMAQKYQWQRQDIKWFITGTLWASISTFAVHWSFTHSGTITPHNVLNRLTNAGWTHVVFVLLASGIVFIYTTWPKAVGSDLHWCIAILCACLVVALFQPAIYKHEPLLNRGIAIELAALGLAGAVIWRYRTVRLKQSC